MIDHDEYTCDCHETCGWCCVITAIKDLRDFLPEDVWLCPDCFREATA